MESDYVIDLERLNKLTTHHNDNPNNTNNFGTSFAYSTTRGVIKEYMKIYLDKDSRKPNLKLPEVIETLHYNGILVSKSDIRDGKIQSILND